MLPIVIPSVVEDSHLAMTIEAILDYARDDK